MVFSNALFPVMLATGVAGTTTSSTISDSSTIVDGVTKLADSINSNGALVTICAVFILFFILLIIGSVSLIIKLAKKNESNANSTIEGYNQVMSLISTALTESMTTRQNTEVVQPAVQPNVEKEEEKKNEHITNILGMAVDESILYKGAAERVIEKLHCNRVAIYVFHNGNSSGYGLPFVKMSCIYENTDNGMHTKRARDANVPLHVFAEMLSELYRNKEFGASESDPEWHEASVSEFISNSPTKAFYMKAIEGDKGIAGFTVCEFDEVVDIHGTIQGNLLRGALQDMNEAIHYVITNQNFSNRYN